MSSDSDLERRLALVNRIANWAAFAVGTLALWIATPRQHVIPDDLAFDMLLGGGFVIVTFIGADMASSVLARWHRMRGTTFSDDVQVRFIALSRFLGIPIALAIVWFFIR